MTDVTSDTGFRCGVIAVVGRPNVGKSTLMNRLIGQHLAITSSKPQTTRENLLGIRTTARAQLIFVDTPGLHDPEGRQRNREINRTAIGGAEGADVVLFVCAVPGWTEADEHAFAQVAHSGVPVVIAINKVDRTADKTKLLPLLASIHEGRTLAGIVPISAMKGDNLEGLERLLIEGLPEQPAAYESNRLTDRDQAWLICERVREQVFRRFGEELPYGVNVRVERMHKRSGGLEVHAVIDVPRENHKAILIGRGGQALKVVGTEARKSIEALIGGHLWLHLFVRVSP